MKTERVISEWKECRNTIGRFDNYLLRLRLLGFSIFTLLFTAIVGAGGTKKGISAFTPEALLFVILTLTLFVLAIYILDRYYERMLLIAVYRASYLEAHRLEGFRIGLTTEIEFQKEKISRRMLRSNFLKASQMVNFVYALIFITMWIQYFILSKRIEQSTYYDFILGVVIIIVTLLAIAAHMLLNEPGILISLRSKVVKSPVVMSREEIKYSVKRIASEINKWITSENANELHIISVLSGARPFTEDLIKELEHYEMSIFLHVVRIEATKEIEHLDECRLVYGVIDSSIEGRLVLVVDDLLDSGRTLQKVKDIVKDNGVKSIKTAVLINKYIGSHVNADFIGLNLGLNKNELITKGIDDYWLFGYGMDLDGQYRDIEHIGWIEKKNKKP